MESLKLVDICLYVNLTELLRAILQLWELKDTIELGFKHVGQANEILLQQSLA
jgi:hypothetical protein